ncbi:hypothetical protein BUALT_Bualt01G0187000 [Buddleja alternifolia]|uniref:Uncharacterized protein n=1 Tax=Buddleja alternifolia TaxID=168488 RepID=A0AAV6YCG1_9LAMI|nr:hypothetical protein BUALT_Bualt01G0187000 [Buddleja alternifolia]
MALPGLIRHAVGAVWNNVRREWDCDSLRSHQVIGPALLRHLKLVYSSLICVSLSSAFGSYLYLTGTIESSVVVLGSFVNTISFYFVAPRKQNTRLCLLISGAFFGGAIIAHCMTRFLNVDTGKIVKINEQGWRGYLSGLPSDRNEIPPKGNEVLTRMLGCIKMIELCENVGCRSGDGRENGVRVFRITRESVSYNIVTPSFVVFSLSSSSVVLGTYLKICKLANHYTTWMKIWAFTFVLGCVASVIWLPLVADAIGGDVARLQLRVRID